MRGFEMVGPLTMESAAQPGGPFLVFEVGGTTMRGGRFDTERSAIERRVARPTPTLSTELPGPALHGRLIDCLVSLGEEILDGAPPDSVSIAFPGPIGPDGSVLSAPTVMGAEVLEPFRLRDDCQRRWPEARIFVINDLTAAGLRYVALGRRDFCIITVGSGIGHKIFVDGRPVVGPRGRGGEIGHLRVDWGHDALPCECGGLGHLGGIASGRGVRRHLQRQADSDPVGFAASSLCRSWRPSHQAGPTRLDVFDSLAICEAFVGDDPWVTESVASAVCHLGRAIAAIHLAVGVEEIIVMGGFALALGERFRRLLVDAATAASWDLGQDWNAMIELALPDDDGGMIGAGLVGAGLSGALGR